MLAASVLQRTDWLKLHNTHSTPSTRRRSHGRRTTTTPHHPRRVLHVLPRLARGLPPARHDQEQDAGDESRLRLKMYRRHAEEGRRARLLPRVRCGDNNRRAGGRLVLHVLRGLQRRNLGDGPASHLLAGVGAEAVACVVFVPVDVVKERCQVHSYTSSYECFRTVLKKEGPRALYRGYAPTLWSFGAFSGLYWAFYEQLRPSDTSVSFADALPCALGAGAAGVVADGAPGPGEAPRPGAPRRGRAVVLEPWWTRSKRARARLKPLIQRRGRARALLGAEHGRVDGASRRRVAPRLSCAHPRVFFFFGKPPLLFLSGPAKSTKISA